MQCTGCARDIPEGSIVCPFCARPQADEPTVDSSDTTGSVSTLDDAATALDIPTPGPGKTATTSDAPRSGAPLTHSDAGQHGRFLPGTTVAGRYRIVAVWVRCIGVTISHLANRSP